MIDCNWDNPGDNPYRGGVAQAVARYNLPKAVQYELIAKAERLRPDAVLTITKDDAVATTGETFKIKDMHYGKKTLCKGEVQRSAWADWHVEHAMVYCAQGTCIAVPLVCHNVSLLERVSPERGIPRISDNDWRQGGDRHDDDFWSGHKHDKDKDKKDKVHHVPEPSTVWLVGLAAAAMGYARRRAVSKG